MFCLKNKMFTELEFFICTLFPKTILQNGKIVLIIDIYSRWISGIIQNLFKPFLGYILMHKSPHKNVIGEKPEGCTLEITAK